MNDIQQTSVSLAMKIGALAERLRPERHAFRCPAQEMAASMSRGERGNEKQHRGIEIDQGSISLGKAFREVSQPQLSQPNPNHVGKRVRRPTHRVRLDMRVMTVHRGGIMSHKFLGDGRTDSGVFQQAGRCVPQTVEADFRARALSLLSVGSCRLAMQFLWNGTALLMRSRNCRERVPTLPCFMTIAYAGG